MFACFCVSFTKFSFFPFLKPWMEGDAYLWVRAEKSPLHFFCCWNRNPCFVGKGSLFVKSEPSSFASSPRLRKIIGLTVPPSTPFSAATGILWFWLAHQPLVIQNEGLTHTVLENSLPPYWTACFKLKQGNMSQQVSPMIPPHACGTEYVPFLRLWYDSTWDRTPVSWTIGEHSTH